MNTLNIHSAVFDALSVHAEEGYPDEVCGLLLGTSQGGASVRTVVEALRVRNDSQGRARDRYEMNPGDYRRIEEYADQRRLEVVGVYHSHPDHPSRPSTTDLERAVETWQTELSWSYLILEVVRGRRESFRSWTLRDKAFVQEDVQVVWERPRNRVT